MGNETYRKDLIIFSDHVFSPWWRKEGHSLEPNDLFEALRENPSLIIVGTGASGVMN
ncbi:MAG: hypothetical protein GWN27_20845, partial [candidate division Zixibacteria bacterium]|nr:hypothetical protein [candidate division Zixibacteria bacterium]